MSDKHPSLIKRLRTMSGIGWHPIGNEAADEIEKLREEIKGITGHGVKQMEEIERLREALADINENMRQADRYFLKENTLSALQQKDTE